MAYSADDFNAVAFGIDGSRPNARLLFAALRIASLVMKPGVIEGVMTCPFDDLKFDLDDGVPCPACGWTGETGSDSRCINQGHKNLATAIRNRLTGETG